MHRDDDHFPFRQATRLVNEFQHGVSPIWLDLVDRQLDHMNVLLIIYRNALRPNAEACISMHALAASLGRPPETVRRHVPRLVGTRILSTGRTYHVSRGGFPPAAGNRGA